ncbi:MAG: hypothetical protein K2O18_18510 [Oscillospiraceae bacterium]|nr:hypothetical protein [Oscillospiraceae bacterium]
MGIDWEEILGDNADLAEAWMDRALDALDDLDSSVPPDEPVDGWYPEDDGCSWDEDEEIEEDESDLEELTWEKKRMLLLKFGVPENAVDDELRQESDSCAVLPAYRLLKPMNDSLNFYQDVYSSMLKKEIADRTLDTKDPEAAALLHAGATPETVEKFAYKLLLDFYRALLHQLDDHTTGWEFSSVFFGEEIEKCGYGRLMEMGPDGQPTGRYLMNLSGKLPFSALSKAPNDAAPLLPF